MFTNGSNDKSEIDKLMRALVEDLKECQRIIIFPPGTFFLVAFVIAKCIAVVCLSFLFSGIIFPLSGSGEIGVFFILVPIIAAAVLITFSSIQLIAIVIGKKKFLRFLSIYTLSLFVIFCCGVVLSVIGIWYSPSGIQLFGLLAFVSCVFLIYSKQFYMLASYFHAKCGSGLSDKHERIRKM